MVQIEQKIPTLPGLQDLSQMIGDSAPEAVTEIALMTSRMVVGRAVDKLNLEIQVTPHRFPLIGGYIARHFEPSAPGQVAGARLGLDRYDWGGSKLDIYELDVPPYLIGKNLTLVAGPSHTFKLEDEHGNLLLQGPARGPVKGNLRLQESRRPDR